VKKKTFFKSSVSKIAIVQATVILLF
jgi:hypothetical protein